MAATIKIKNSSTANAKPTSSDLVQGELAINVTDKKIFTEDSGGNVVELGANFNGFKNRIINGAMMIDQRNAGASGTASAYTVDRWQFNASLDTKGTWQQNAGAVTPPVGFINYLGFTSNSAYSVGAGEIFTFQQRIEGLNCADLAWGTANAATVTVSFWVRSLLTGTFGGSLRNSAGDRSYPFTYTISAANTWEQKTVTVAGDTTGTWLTTNGIGVNLTFSLGTGSTYSGTAGSWAGANYTSATGATSVVGTSGATFYITGVQLEKGSTATSFDYRPYGTELALCYRYYYQTVSNEGIGVVYSSTQAAFKAKLPVTMRSNPSLTMPTSGSFRGDMANGNKTSAVAPISANPNVSEIYWYNTGYSSASAGELVYWLGSSIKASAEL